MLKKLLNRILPASPAAPASAPLAEDSPAVVAASPAPLAAPIDTTRADALIDEGNALEDAGQPEQAERLYREAVEAAPAHPRAHLNLGIVLAARGDLGGATAAYDRVLALAPDHPFGNYNLARATYVQGDLERTHSLLATALGAKPDFAQALVLQASVLDALGRTAEAVDTLYEALRLQPQDGGAWFNQATMLNKLDRLDDSEIAVRRALEHSSDQPGALLLLSGLLRDQGFAHEALELHRAAVPADSTDWPRRSFELILMIFAEGLAVEDVVRRHLEFGADLERAVPARFEHPVERGDRNRRLRIGYLSCDFKSHPVPFFLMPVLRHHDRTQVEVFCYSFGESRDGVTDHIEKMSDHWRDVQAKSDTEIADLIHADGIDVLVDLVGHTGAPRLAVFSQKPAPVQVSWLGYIFTTGLTRMDFRVCDRRTDPLAVAQPLHSERLLHMPFSQWCYEAMVAEQISPVAPVEKNGFITFGSFNTPLKIGSDICRRWGEALARLPDSRLLVANVGSRPKREAILRDLASVGVDASRVEFLARVPLGEYLALYNRVDIALDSYPYGGGTTTFDSLWMGVPVVTAVGDMPASRSAASILAAFDMQDWIAQSIDDFADVAVARASDREALAAARATLRGRMERSPLTDVRRFTKDLESAYRRMWLADAA